MQSNQTFFLRSIQNLETEQIISQPTKLNKNLMNKMLNLISNINTASQLFTLWVKFWIQNKRYKTWTHCVH